MGTRREAVIAFVNKSPRMEWFRKVRDGVWNWLWPWFGYPLTPGYEGKHTLRETAENYAEFDDGAD